MTDVPDFTSILQMIASGVAVGGIVSFLLANLEFFNRLPRERKRWIVLAICLALPLASTAVLQLVPPDVLASLDPYWRALASGFLVWGGAQVTYIGVIKKDG